ncbi:VIT1/CCC1 transporter family protein [Geoglobus acetivorans]|uniref:VIT1/CCC1 transporter family protein n=1 Tax=Geoglobus acetivorans TaxID=565033 RepID=A0ABZ3H3S4_GEOAI|nr:VIT1/CCC1 transporter family protein [Geoglobus acetivorans]
MIVRRVIEKLLGKDRAAKFRIYSNVTDLSSISRRYFVIGFFDGVLTIMGLVLGAHLSGEANATVIFSAGIATSLALGISSGWGAYEAERVEQTLSALEKRRALLKMDGEQCLIDDAHDFAMKVSSFVHAIAPIPAGVLPLVPYLFLEENMAFLVSLLTGFTLLFIVGVSMGRVSRSNLIKSGARMVLAGVATLLIVTLLSPAHF